MSAELASTLTATEADRLEQAEGVVRGFCGWHIAPSRTETVLLRSRSGNTLLLPSLHVTAVSTVQDDSTALVVEDDYTWSPAGVLTRLGYWGDNTIVAVGMTHGYEEVPPEVTGVVQAIAQRAVSNPGSAIRSQAGPFSEAYSQTGANQSIPLTLLDAEKDILRRYRIPAVA